MVLEWKLRSSVSSHLISMPALLDVYLANVHLMFLLLTDSRLADASPVAASSAQATVIRPSANRARCRIPFPLSWPGSRPAPPRLLRRDGRSHAPADPVSRLHGKFVNRHRWLSRSSTTSTETRRLWRPCWPTRWPPVPAVTCS